jgi:hypothetical protein
MVSHFLKGWRELPEMRERAGHRSATASIESIWQRLLLKGLELMAVLISMAERGI